MADGAGKLDKLARLKNLKSGLKAKSESSGGDTEDLSLDAAFGEEEGAMVAKLGAAPNPAAGAASKKGEPDAESLSAYFEALGIVPDGAKLAGATGMPPKPYAPPSDAYTNSAEAKGRDVDERDRWPDPVREDDAFLSSFAGVAKPTENAKPTEEVEDDEDLSLDSIIGSFDEDDDDDPGTVKIETTPVDVEETRAVEDLLVEEASDEELSEDELSIADLMAEELSADPVPELKVPVDPKSELEPEFEPLGKPVDIEAFEKEIGLSDSEPKSSNPVAVPVGDPISGTPGDDAAADQPLSITFDETRASLLAHVSKQMNCSIDDVVVTAIDWYLDALFGEDDPEVGADAGK